MTLPIIILARGIMFSTRPSVCVCVRTGMLKAAFSDRLAVELFNFE